MIRAKPRAIPIIPSVAMKGGIPSLPTADAVGGAERRAAEQAGGDAGGETVALVHHQRGGDARGGQHRADRKVDAGRQDHEGLADREQRDHRGLDRDLEQVVEGEEVGREARENQPHRQQDPAMKTAGLSRISSSSPAHHRVPERASSAARASGNASRSATLSPYSCMLRGGRLRR